MLMFPYILNLLAAMLLGALIGAERQWRQRMADYALMRWWRQAPPFYSGAHDDIARQPRRIIAAQIVLVLAFGAWASSCAKR